MVLNEKITTRYEEYLLFFYEGGEILGQVAQRGDRCPISENIQGQVGVGSEYLNQRTEKVLVHCEGAALDGF